MSRYSDAQWELLRIAESHYRANRKATAKSLVRAAQALGTLPSRARTEYARLIEKADPFHPDALEADAA